MRILIDTNVLISAALNADGVPYQAYVTAAFYPNHGLICEQNAEEWLSKRKFAGIQKNTFVDFRIPANLMWIPSALRFGPC